MSTAFINKLESWPKIGPKDAVALREFSDFLDKILAAKNTIPGLSILDYAKENVKLLAKLPYHLEIKWRDVIKQWRHTHGEASYPTFLKFAEFIREAAEKANIPELEDMSALTSPRVNKPQRRSQKRVVLYLHQLRMEITLNQILVVLVNQSTLVKTTQTSACFAVLYTSWRTALISAECLSVKEEISSFVNICVWAVRPVGVTRWRTVRKD